MDNQISDNNWQNKYLDPIIRAAAKARYEDLQNQLLDLLSEKQKNDQEIIELQKFWNTLINRQKNLGQRINQVKQDIYNVIKENTEPANQSTAKPSPIPKVPSNSLLEDLKTAKLKEQELHNSPTATAMDIAIIQQKIKDLQNKLKQ